MDAYISSLPDDALYKIFMLNAQRWSKASFKSTIYASHVCSRWRSLLISYPMIWARIIRYDSVDEDCLLEMLSRAKSCPLDVGWYRLDDSSASERRIIEKELQSLPKFRSYFLNFAYRSLSVVKRNLTNQQAPLLEELHCRLSKDNPNMVWIIPDTAFSTTSPVLRSITLEKCWIDLRQNRFRDITSLSVRHVIDDRFTSKKDTSIPMQTFEDWIDIFSYLPMLEIFELEFFEELPMARTPEGGFYRAVNLPKLEQIKLHLHARTMHNFLRHLSMPSAYIIDLGCFGIHPSGSTINSCFDVIEGQLNLPAFQEEGNNFCLSILTDLDGLIKLRFSSESPFNECTKCDMTFTINTLFQLDDWEQSDLDIYYSQLDRVWSLSLPRATSLKLEVKNLSLTLLHLLGQAKGIKRLWQSHVPNWSLPAFVQSYTQAKQAHTSPVLLPGLTDLVFNSESSVEDQELLNSKTLRVLHRFLDQRSEIGVPISKIIFSGFELSDSNKDSLVDRGIEVVVLQWPSSMI